MTNIKVLGIAPYEGMKTLMETVAENRSHIDLTVYVGDLNEGVRILSNMSNNKYDVILSRGGTAELLRNTVNIPVVEINISVYDILRIIRLLENYTGSYAIVGFPSITKCAHILCELLNTNIPTITVHNTDEVDNALNMLKKDGFQVVVCDMVTHTRAKAFGLNAILITSGTESIEEAFDQIEKISECYSHFKNKEQLINTLLFEQDRPMAIYDEDGKLVFSSLGKSNNSTVLSIFHDLCESMLKDENSIIQVKKRTSSDIYSIEGKKILYKDKTYLLFYLTADPISISETDKGITFCNKDDVQDLYDNSYYGIWFSINSTDETIAKYNQVSFPLLILGEAGCGKDAFAYKLYKESKLNNNSLIIINCDIITEKQWDSLMSQVNSPLNSSNFTIYFRHIHALSKSQGKALCTIMSDSMLYKRNRIILSLQCRNGSEKDNPLYIFLTTQTPALPVYMQTLREQTDNLSNFISLYLNELNTKLAKHIIGINPDALQLLSSYDWPYNFSQLKRVLSTLVTLCSGSYITLQNVEKVLSYELAKPSNIPNDTHAKINLKQTLDKINKDIIKIVLQEEGGNQSKSAKRLGISRTTLWRMLK